MPDTIRASSGGSGACPRIGRWRAAIMAGTCLAGSCLIAAGRPAGAASLYDNALASFTGFDRYDMVGLVMTLGLSGFAVVTAITLLRTRARAQHSDNAYRDEIATLRAQVDRANALLLSDPQVIIAWAAADDQPEILGDTSSITGAHARHRVLAFGTWLDAEKAKAMEHAVDALRTQAVPFSMTLTTQAGHPVEADGRAIGGRAVLRLRDVEGARRDLVELAARHRKLASDVGSLSSLIETLPSPVWVRDGAGRLVFVNTAYVRAVEAIDAEDALDRGIELLDRAARDEVTRALATGSSHAGRFPAIVAGQRRIFDVIDLATTTGSAGMAIDATETDNMSAEVERRGEAHRRLLDQLATGVAIFGADRRLAFYNAAYRMLWDLEPAFLDHTPTDGAVLDRLRSARKLPEEQDFRVWKAELHEAYRAIEAKEQMWHLPDGRTLRVVTSPNPEGGVTYLFEDVTERLDLERRFDALIRVQRETLDNLGEAVAVFGSDGRMRLFNPVFAKMWRLDPAQLEARPHIETVAGWCQPTDGARPTWQALRSAVTRLEDRAPVSERLERRDGSVVDCATMPLPDGATLVTFQDVTDTVNVERALRERNEALEAADEIKVDFVHHVSYELRSPLTNIIGFAHFLGDPATGTLSTKQHEYLSYITTSTNALLALINNILDLATIDAGAMTLNLGAVDIRQTMDSAAEGVLDRLVKDSIKLDIKAASDIGSFNADERRLRQILFNLLANALGFSPPHSTVTLAAERHNDAVVFSVTDQGPGIPEAMRDKVFDWFESHSHGSRHRGPGLGLSLVRSFVELHGGTVEIDSVAGQGTKVVCSFPLQQTAARTAAE
jgi:signal transduction histidine kinase